MIQFVSNKRDSMETIIVNAGLSINATTMTTPTITPVSRRVVVECVMDTVDQVKNI